MLILQTKPYIFLLCIFVYIAAAALVSGSSMQGRYSEAIKHDVERHKAMASRYNQRNPGATLPKKRIAAERRLSTGPPDKDVDIPIGSREPLVKSTIEGSVRIPLYTGSEFGLGSYMADVEIGEPPKKLRLVVDTGSTLTWVKCSKDYTNVSSTEGQGFVTTQSSTYKTVACATDYCTIDFATLASLNICPNPTAQCLYNYSYGFDEMTYTYGGFGNDVITLPTTTGKPTRLEHVLLGCSETYMGRARLKAADGILGLGMHDFSFSMLGLSKFGGTFQYCLVDHLSKVNESSYLVFGAQREKAPMYAFMRYTPLGISFESPYLFLYVKGISIGSKMLDIPPLVWFSEYGGTIIDSGSTLSYLVTPAYQAVMNEFKQILGKDHPNMFGDGGDVSSDMEYCFNSTKYPFGKDDYNKFPRLQIHFSDGTRFKPHVKSYIIDDGLHVKCIGFMELRGGMNVIGNILQQNYLWEFDINNGMLGFSPSTCS